MKTGGLILFILPQDRPGGSAAGSFDPLAVWIISETDKMADTSTRTNKELPLFSYLNDFVPRINATTLFAFVLACAAPPLIVATAEENRQQPNLIVIFTDDHGYADLSCQGILSDVKTPHIDALAASGARMTSGYVTAPQCVPSRAGLLTGKHQNRFGVESNGLPLDGFDSELTIAERLKAVGYATGMIGKWHLGPTAKIVDHGFDDVFYRGGSWTNFDIEGNTVPPGTNFNDLYHLDAGSAAAKAFIKRHHDEPFFLYLAYRAPHVPLDATKKYLSRFPGEMPERRRQALAMLSAVDDGVGGVVDSLREYGIEENTLIFFIGDNGAPLKIHKHDAPGGGPGWDGSLNDPLNGEKGMLSDGGMRVPFVVSWKGTIPGGQVDDRPVISLDVAATACAIAGVPDDPALDGVNLIPFLNGNDNGMPHETLYWRWIAQAAVREGRWKYLRGGSREYLFDLSTDKEERRNLLLKHPDTAAALSKKLTAWASEMQPPGLETKQMSEVWEQYFDFYLDGKPAPPRPSSAAPSSDSVDGWVVRNCRAKQTRAGLVLRPNATLSADDNVFIAANRLSLPADFRMKVRLSSPQPGPVKIQWREEGQRDFGEGQIVSMAEESSVAVTEIEGQANATKKVIHIRLLCPKSGTTIQSVEIFNNEDERLRRWDFRK